VLESNEKMEAESKSNDIIFPLILPHVELFYHILCLTPKEYHRTPRLAMRPLKNNQPILSKEVKQEIGESTCRPFLL
jgi:hypothetical protein